MGGKKFLEKIPAASTQVLIRCILQERDEAKARIDSFNSHNKCSSKEYIKIDGKYINKT